MRKKYTSKTYMRGVTDRDLLIIKKINKTTIS